MARHNRLLKPAIRYALTGDENGISSEVPARSARTIREKDSSDESSCSDFSDGEDQAEGNIAANRSTRSRTAPCPPPTGTTTTSSRACSRGRTS